MTPTLAGFKKNEEFFYSNILHNRKNKTPKYKIRELVRTTDKRNIFSKGDATTLSSEFYSIPQVIDDAIPSYRISFYQRDITKRC